MKVEGVEAARERGERRADAERRHLVQRHVDAERRRGELIRADRLQGATEARPHPAEEGDDENDDDDEHEIIHRDGRGEGYESDREGRNPDEPGGPACQIAPAAGENCAREEMSDGIQIDFLSQNEWLARRAQLLTFFSGASLKCGYVCACPRRESDFTDAVSAQQETR